MADLENAFFNAEAQAKLKRDLERIADPVFLISEEVASSDNTVEDGDRDGAA